MGKLKPYKYHVSILYSFFLVDALPKRSFLDVYSFWKSCLAKRLRDMKEKKSDESELV